MKKAIIVGATSGIGRELAVVLSQNGYVLGLVGRRGHCLEELKDDLSTQVFTRQIHRAIQRKAHHAYVTRRWRLFAWLFRVLPDFILAKP